MQNEKQPLGIEQDNRPLLTQPKKFSLDSGINTESGQRLYTEQSSRSPIYTYKPEKMVGSDSAVAGNQSRERLVRPGTPYTEIDESKVGLSKKVLIVLFQLSESRSIFQKFLSEMYPDFFLSRFNENIWK